MESLINETKRHFFVLTQLDENDLNVLIRHAPLTSQWAPAFSEAFYGALMGYEATRSVFKPEEMEARHRTLIEWYLSVSSGKIDEEFWRRQWFVGLVHIKRGVKNEFMSAMMHRVQELFAGKAFEELPSNHARVLVSAFNKITNGIEMLIGEGYRQGYLHALKDSTGLDLTLLNTLAKNSISDLLQEFKGRSAE